MTKKIGVNQLTGLALDWAVAKACGYDNWDGEDPDFSVFLSFEGEYCCVRLEDLNSSENWDIGGSIIERERITILCSEGRYDPSEGRHGVIWVADIGEIRSEEVYGSQGDYWGRVFEIDENCISGSTPLEAAMRCFVASKFGSSVEVPKDLVTI